MKSKLSILALMFILFISCGEKRESSEEIKIVYADWAEASAMTYLVKNIFEERLNYKVILKLTDVQDAYRLVAEGKYDLFLDAWLPETHSKYVNEYGDNIDDLGYNYTDAKTGFVAPAYSKANNIPDLSKMKINEGRIFGIDSLAGVSIAGNKAIKDYNLDYRLIYSGSKKMLDILDSLYKRREEVVITGWRPHWMMNIYDLKFLEDPKNIFGEHENIHTISRLNFTKDYPELADFFNNFKLNNEQINSLMYEISISARPEDGVENWVGKNSVLVNKWTHGMRIKRNFN